ncbi:hypothetical protein F5Y12DRAFT_709660 [Xylaria sp. FL1777]|nr:hypothetical protein F5Y12DRAFT_709660 [Xylaria sp. FL1777]
MLIDISIPTSCLTETWLIPASGTAGAGAVLGNPADPNCWAGAQDLGTTVSPAICPYGYASACNIDYQSRRDASETLFACCPIGFTCDIGSWSCISHFIDLQSRTLFVTDTNEDGLTTVTPIVQANVNAHSIRVAFHSSDIIDQSASTTDSARLTITPAPTATLSTSTSTVTPPVTKSGSIPTGVFVGIGVASALGAVILLLGIFWLVRRRYRRKQQHPLSSPPPTPPLSTTRSTFEPVNECAEMFSISKPSALNGAPLIHELDSYITNYK